MASRTPPVISTTDALLAKLDELGAAEGKLADIARERALDDADAMVAVHYHRMLADTLRQAAWTLRLYTN